MSDEIPDYYRSLAASDDDEDASVTKEAASSGEPSSQERPETRFYRADSFRMMLPGQAWRDRSVYTITGPTVDGRPHSIVITVVEGVDVPSVADFAAAQVESSIPGLDECRVLKDGSIELDCGHPAHRVILHWTSSMNGKRLYAEQIFVLHQKRGYILTATFTRASRKQIGEEVERMMLSFQPIERDHRSRGEAFHQ